MPRRPRGSRTSRASRPIRRIASPAPIPPAPMPIPAKSRPAPPSPCWTRTGRAPFRTSGSPSPTMSPIISSGSCCASIGTARPPPAWKRQSAISSAWAWATITAGSPRCCRWAAIKSLNSYFPMPFGHHARITVTNEGKQPIGDLYYNIDYRTYAHPLPAGHAVFPCAISPGPAQSWLDQQLDCAMAIRWSTTKPISTARTITSGWTPRATASSSASPCRCCRTRTIGGAKATTCSSSMARRRRPSRAPASEDYFLGAWDFGGEPFSYQLYGAPVVGEELAGSRSSVYRFHLDPPIPFSKSFKATIEHGNANASLGQFLFRRLLVSGRTACALPGAAHGRGSPAQALSRPAALAMPARVRNNRRHDRPIWFPGVNAVTARCVAPCRPSISPGSRSRPVRPAAIATMAAASMRRGRKCAGNISAPGGGWTFSARIGGRIAQACFPSWKPMCRSI